MPLADPKIAEHSLRFFKTGKGEYGEGDKFLGIRVPVLRKAVKTFKLASIEDSLKLLKNEYHEIRLFALLLLVEQYQKGNDETQYEIYQHYLAHYQYINNWDLVDSSCHHIIGHFLLKNDKQCLLDMANSNNLWLRRIAMMSTYYFIKHGHFETTITLAKILLHDKHDLIHKVVGWMLRELGNKNRELETNFLNQYYQEMPRTMLRYAIEKYSPEQRQLYLKGLI